MKSICLTVVAFFAALISLHAQSTNENPPTSQTGSKQALEQRVTHLEAEITELKMLVKQLTSSSSISAATNAPSGTASGAAIVSSAATSAAVTAKPDSAASVPKQAYLNADDLKNLDFLRGTTINLALDTYYEYNFNHPVGRVNLLRAYDV